MTGLFSSLTSTRRPDHLTTTKAHEAAVGSQASIGSWVLAEPVQYADEASGDADVRRLNSSLRLLCDVFPDVQPAVFREMLSKLSGESRTAIITERLLQDKGKCVHGRYRVVDHGTRVSDAGAQAATTALPSALDEEQHFRSAQYQKAVTDALRSEFKTLSRSSIKAVLAEQNFSYVASRPMLQQISSKSWRSYFSTLWSKKQQAASDVQSHPLITWHTPQGLGGPQLAFLKPTSSKQLNHEIYAAYIAPTLKLHKDKCDVIDAKLAMDLALQDATDNQALFECQCCYDEVIFERIVSCSDKMHLLCFDCIRRATEEAVHGQSWSKTVDMERTTLRCLAASDRADCCLIPVSLMHRALVATASLRLWQDFEDKISKRNYSLSQLPMLQCPFCPYAEVEVVPAPVLIAYSIARRRLMSKLSPLQSHGTVQIVLGLAMALLFCVHLATGMILPLLHLWTPLEFERSWRRVYWKQRGYRFICLNPRCGVSSCVRCRGHWRDPHTCYEDQTKTLRQAIEAATTNVVKRVCPRCNTSFVHSGGCNKMSCVCGYKMCYICRAEIGSEGYSHFCQHFRVDGGKCKSCDACELYRTPDEKHEIQMAAENAEAAWRAKHDQGSTGLPDSRIRDIKRDMLSKPSMWDLWAWDWETVLDGALAVMLEAEQV